MVSVIIPFYNAAKFLDRCINSVLLQTYTDFELLLIDDGSTDGSAAVCERYADKDRRLRLVRLNHGGVCAARNSGLLHAQGEFISFIDADDWVDSDILQTFVDSIGDAQLCIQDMIMHDADKVWSLGLADGFVSSPAEIARASRLYGSCCNALFLASVIKENSLFFDTSMTRSEDTDFIMRYSLYINKVRITPHAAYHYLMPDASKAYATSNLLYGSVKLYENMLRLTEHVGTTERKTILDEEMAEDIDWAIEGLFYYPDSDAQTREGLLRKFSDYFYPNLRLSHRASFRHRLFRLLCLSSNPSFIWNLSRGIMAVQKIVSRWQTTLKRNNQTGK